MSTMGICVLAFLAWMLGAVMVATANPFADVRYVIWWPIELVKLLVRTLWATLTTGWRP